MCWSARLVRFAITPANRRRPLAMGRSRRRPYRRSLESAIREAGISTQTVLAGRVDRCDLHAWYEAADLFVHPSLYEGSSLVTLEAMAHRKAVVATRAGGLPDKFDPGRQRVAGAGRRCIGACRGHQRRAWATRPAAGDGESRARLSRTTVLVGSSGGGRSSAVRRVAPLTL